MNDSELAKLFALASIAQQAIDAAIELEREYAGTNKLAMEMSADITSSAVQLNADVVGVILANITYPLKDDFSSTTTQKATQADFMDLVG